MKLRIICEKHYEKDMPVGEKGRLAQHPHARKCARCKKKSKYWDISDKQWEKIPKKYRNSHICKECFNDLVN